MRLVVRSFLALGLAATGLALAAPAQAVVTVDCSAGPVDLVDSTETYVLTGACSDVTVSGSNVRVTLTTADSLLIKEGNSIVKADDLGTVTLLGANNTVKADDVDKAVLRGGNQALRVDGDAPKVKVLGANNLVTADEGTKLTIKGANNTIRYDELDRLVIKGANNFALVREGMTKVSVTGANNVVRVHRRG